MNHKERMLAELPYRTWLDGLEEDRCQNSSKIFELNHLHPQEHQKRNEVLREILGAAGKELCINSPFYCDYGKNIFVGECFYANYNCTILDVAKVTIGDHVMFGPNVSLYTAGHPLHPESRKSGYEYGIGITIGNNVWLGGNVVVNPGVRIGDNTVIGSGSVVTRDIPDHVFAAGNPCRVIRKITEEDRNYYFRDRKFDVDDF